MKNFYFVLAIVSSMVLTTSHVSAEVEVERTYTKKDSKACASLKITCEEGQTPFTDATGCGCEMEKISTSTLKYKSLTIEEAGITIDYPKTWPRQGKEMAWSPTNSGRPLLGFKWIDIEPDWEPVAMLPKNSEFLGPFMIDLGWERGLLFLTHPQTMVEKDHLPFEIHVIVPRMDAQLAYDFYAQGNSFAQLKEVEMVFQNIIQSGVLNNIKNYHSENPKECKNLELECGINEEKFFDNKGCGCMIVPSTSGEVFDN